MNRRDVLATLATAAALWPRDGFSQIPRKLPLVAFLGGGSKAAGARFFGGFLQGMRELGYAEGGSYTFEARYADGDIARLPTLAQELVRLKPDVIVGSIISAVLAIRQFTDSIPIVGPSMSDPVAAGLAKSEARPGLNVTGIRNRVDGLPGKQVELALDIVPGLSKIGALIHTGNVTNTMQRQEIESAAAKLGVGLVPVEIRAGDEVGTAFQTFARERAGLVIILGDTMFLTVRRQIAAYALASRVATIHVYREHVEDGGLISYGINLHENFRRAAYFVDRILKGEKAGDLPIEFPNKLELVINLTTARAIGLSVPQTLLARADEVIE